MKHACCGAGCARCPFRTVAKQSRAKRQAALQFKNENDYRSRVYLAEMAERDAVLARVRPGETAIPYAHDCAECSCPPVPKNWPRGFVPLEVIFVGRNKAAGTDRCLHCGTTWTLRMFRSDPARIVEVSA